MKVVSRYCDSCGVKIPGDDIAGGDALKYEESYYCRECKADVMPLIGKSDKGKRRRGGGVAGAVHKAAGAGSAKRAGGAGKAPDKGRAGKDGGNAPVKRKTRPKASPDAASKKAPRAGTKSGGTRRPGARAAGADATGERPARRAKARKAAEGEPRAGGRRAAGKAPRGTEREEAGASSGGTKRRVRDEAGAGSGGTRRRSRDKAGAASSGSKSRAKRPGRAASESGEDTGRGSRSRKGGGDRARKGDRSRGRAGASRSRSKSSADGSMSSDDFSTGGSNKTLLLIGGGVVLAIVAAVGIYFAVAGGNNTGDAAADANAEAAAAREARADQSKQLYQDTLAKIGDEPTDLTEAIANLENISSGLEPGEKKLATEKIAAYTQKRDTDAQARWDELSQRADALIDEKLYGDALELLQGYPAQYRATDVWAEVQNKVREVAQAAQAEREIKPLLDEAQAYQDKGDFPVAIGILEGFDIMHYADTEWAELVRDRIAELALAQSKAEQAQTLEDMAAAKAKAEEERRVAEEKRKRDEDERIASMDWEPWFGEDLFTHKYPEPRPVEAWKVVDRVLQGTSGAALMPNIGAITGVGQSTWKDYIFRVKYKVVKGDFSLGVRVSQRGAFVHLEPETRNDNSWQTITVSVRGQKATGSIQEITPGGGMRDVKFDAHDSSQGGIAFVLAPNSEVHFKDLEVKVINRGSR
ncbi:MAG: hypothetical protein ACYS22_03020 [Planctomycetota bacterium]